MKRLVSVILKISNSPTFTTWGVFGVRFLDLIFIIPLVLTSYTSFEIAIFFLFESLFQLSSLITKRVSIIITRITSFALAGASELGPIKESKSISNSDSPNYAILANIFATSRWIFLALGLLAAFICAIGGYIGINNLLKGEAANDGLWTTFLFVLFSCFATNYFTRLDSFLKGLNKVALSNKYTIFFRLVSVVIAPILILNGFSIHIVVVSVFSMRIVNEFSKIIPIYYDEFVRKIEKKRLLYFDRKIINSILEPLWKGLISVVSSKGVLELSGVIFTSFGDPAIVAAYLFGLRIMSAISQFSQAPFSSMNPYFSKLKAAGKIDELRKIFLQRIFISLALFTVITIIIGFTGDLLMSFIDSKIAFLPTSVWLVWSLFFLYDMYMTYLVSICAIGNVVIFYWHDLICAIISLILLALVPPTYGVIAIIIALFLPKVLIFNLGPLFPASKYINIKPKILLTRTFLPISVIYSLVIILSFTVL